MNNYSDVIILGAGAAGLFCASQAAKLGKQVTLLDNGKKIGRKILMSGGGFCNFTNLEVTPQHYLSQNPHFVKSALARYTQWDFIAMVASYGIAYHEKELGQLFTDEGAEKIVDMLATECANYQVNIQLRQQVSDIRQLNQADAEQGRKGRFALLANGTTWYCDALVIATGGLSMPGLGATPLAIKWQSNLGLRFCHQEPA